MNTRFYYLAKLLFVSLVVSFLGVRCSKAQNKTVNQCTSNIYCKYAEVINKKTINMGFCFTKNGDSVHIKLNNKDTLIPLDTLFHLNENSFEATRVLLSNEIATNNLKNDEVKSFYIAQVNATLIEQRYKNDKTSLLVDADTMSSVLELLKLLNYSALDTSCSVRAIYLRCKDINTKTAGFKLVINRMPFRASPGDLILQLNDDSIKNSCTIGYGSYILMSKIGVHAEKNDSLFLGSIEQVSKELEKQKDKKNFQSEILYYKVTPKASISKLINTMETIASKNIPWLYFYGVENQPK